MSQLIRFGGLAIKEADIIFIQAHNDEFRIHTDIGQHVSKKWPTIYQDVVTYIANLTSMSHLRRFGILALDETKIEEMLCKDDRLEIAFSNGVCLALSRDKDPATFLSLEEYFDNLRGVTGRPMVKPTTVRQRQPDPDEETHKVYVEFLEKNDY